jgi:hypothetical protein
VKEGRKKKKKGRRRKKEKGKKRYFDSGPNVSCLEGSDFLGDRRSHTRHIKVSPRLQCLNRKVKPLRDGGNKRLEHLKMPDFVFPQFIDEGEGQQVVPRGKRVKVAFHHAYMRKESNKVSKNFRIILFAFTY